MLIAVLSDIHGNARALKACLGHARDRGAQGYVFLGDYISDGAYPQRTMEQVYDCAARFDCRFIRGNREEYMLDYRAGKISGWQDGSSTGSLLYTYENLTARDLDWFQSLEIAGRESFSGAPPLFYCHGSPWAVGGRLEQGDPAVKEKLGDLPEKYILCGHTHRLGSWFSGLFERGCQQVVRAGSVGFPLSTPGKAQMLFLHSVEGDMPRWRPEYALVPYDLEGAGGSGRVRPAGTGPGVDSHGAPCPHYRGKHGRSPAALCPGSLRAGLRAQGPLPGDPGRILAAGGPGIPL